MIIQALVNLKPLRRVADRLYITNAALVCVSKRSHKAIFALYFFKKISRRYSFMNIAAIFMNIAAIFMNIAAILRDICAILCVIYFEKNRRDIARYCAILRDIAAILSDVACDFVRYSNFWHLCWGELHNLLTNIS